MKRKYKVIIESDNIEETIYVELLSDTEIVNNVVNNLIKESDPKKDYRIVSTKRYKDD